MNTKLYQFVAPFFVCLSLVDGSVKQMSHIQIVHVCMRIGVTYPELDGPADGIALSPDTNTLYYCSVRGVSLWRIDTAVLRDFSVVCVVPNPPSSPSSRLRPRPRPPRLRIPLCLSFLPSIPRCHTHHVLAGSPCHYRANNPSWLFLHDEMQTPICPRTHVYPNKLFAFLCLCGRDKISRRQSGRIVRIRPSFVLAPS